MIVDAELDFHLRQEARDSAIVGMFLSIAIFIPIAVITIITLPPSPFDSVLGRLVFGIYGALLLISPLLLLHWLPAAFLGRGDVLRIKLSNVLILVAAAMAALPFIVDFTYICDWRGISNIESQRNPNTFCFDSCTPHPTPCAKFLDPIDRIVFGLLPLNLFIASTVSRVLISRKKAICI